MSLLRNSPRAPRASRLSRPLAGAWPALLRRAALPLALGACADSLTQPRDDLARLSASAAVVGTPVSTIVISVSAADIARPLVFTLAASGGLAAGKLYVPPGPARTFTAHALDAAGQVTHDGSATTDVRKGDNDALAIAMAPRAAEVPITVTLGSLGVAVSPASAALTVADTLRLSAVVSYERGQAVAGAVPLWASSNPAVASVSWSGLVTAHTPGKAQIIATYGGGAGVSAVTVSSANPALAKIAFVSIREGTAGIFVMNADGTGLTRVTNNIASDLSPAWR